MSLQAPFPQVNTNYSIMRLFFLFLLCFVFQDKRPSKWQKTAKTLQCDKGLCCLKPHPWVAAKGPWG